MLDIVAARDIEAGREIHNTYGEHGNAILLRKYAFCLRVNPFTEVMLDASRVETLAMEAFVGSGQKAARSKAWARLKEWLG